jgi:L-alanine-DL-glutamate epimerase-like enolase superfamily enzyme
MSGARIAEVDAVWLRCPLPAARQHTSDFGRLETFDATLVTVTTEDGLRGFGEAKAAVGSAGSGAALAALVREELRPLLVGQDARQVNRLWARMYNGPRAGHAERRGRAFPALGRRGLHVCAMSGVDMALWDLCGKRAGMPVLDLVGGAAREVVPAYASGGWAPADRIGDELGGYVQQGFRAVKMRIGVMDGAVAASVGRARQARHALGPGVDLMVDAHGTFSTPEAKAFCAGAADLGLRWLEEPVSPDNREAAAEVRRATAIPIAAGESESTCFDFHDLVRGRAVDVLQPDLAICGGLTEGLRVSALAVAAQLELAPHCWGSPLSLAAGLTLAFASPAGVFVEWCMGANPLLRELCEEELAPRDGVFSPPRGPGWGLTPRTAFIEAHRQ